MTDRERLIDRLQNWKFEQAKNVPGITLSEVQAELLTALAETFSNSGWFSGHLGTIIEYTVAALCVEIEHGEPQTEPSLSPAVPEPDARRPGK